MNLVFFALLDDFVSFFKDGVFSNIDFNDFSGSNVRDMLKAYFENEEAVIAIIKEHVEKFSSIITTFLFYTFMVL